MYGLIALIVLAIGIPQILIAWRSIVSSGAISEQIGIPKSSEDSYSLVRHVLLRLEEEHKRYVANPARGIWQITPEGEAFLDTDF